MVLGATRTTGRATASALVRRGHDVTCLVRPRSEQRAEDGQDLTRPVAVWIGEVTDARSFAEDIIAVSNSLSGVLRRLPKWVADDARAIDYQGNIGALSAAQTAGVKHMILLSANCL